MRNIIKLLLFAVLGVFALSNTSNSDLNDKYRVEIRYCDTNLVYELDSVGIFNPEMLAFKSLHDAIKYWYDQKIFTITLNVPKSECKFYVLANENDILFRCSNDTVFAYDLDDIGYKWVKMGKDSVLILSTGRILTCDIPAGISSVGKSAQDIIPALKLPADIDLSGIESVVIKSATHNTIESKVYEHIELTFKFDTLYQIAIGENGIPEEFRDILDNDSNLKRLAVFHKKDRVRYPN